MSHDEFIPNWASAPGETVWDIMGERGWTAREVAPLLGMDAAEFDSFLTGGVLIDAALAGKLASVIGAPATFWLKREEHYRADLIRLGGEVVLVAAAVSKTDGG